MSKPLLISIEALWFMILIVSVLGIISARGAAKRKKP